MNLKKFIYRIVKNFKFLPKKTFLKVRYHYYTGKKLNLENPIKFNEKIQWLKLYYHVPLLTQLADKFAVRDYVRDKIGKEYLNELLGVYDNVEAIDFSLFPSRFVLKGTHGSSTNLIVKDKDKLNLVTAKKKMKRWMKHNQYKKVGFEWAYKDIKPQIICEAFLEEGNGNNLIDYKFHCFNGKPKFVFVSLDEESYKRHYYYDMNWNKLSFSKNNEKSAFEEIEKPLNFNEMIGFAEKLADKLPFVRVDFYAIKGKTIFGEMTFYPADGRVDYYPDKYNKIIGDYIVLPQIPEGQKTITNYH